MAMEAIGRGIPRWPPPLDGDLSHVVSWKWPLLFKTENVFFFYRNVPIRKWLLDVIGIGLDEGGREKTNSWNETSTNESVNSRPRYSENASGNSPNNGNYEIEKLNLERGQLENNNFLLFERNVHEFDSIWFHWRSRSMQLAWNSQLVFFFNFGWIIEPIKYGGDEIEWNWRHNRI